VVQDDYVIVSRDPNVLVKDGKDLKSAVPPRSIATPASAPVSMLPSVKDVLRNAKSRGGKKGLTPVSTWLAIDIDETSSTNSALTTVLGVPPSSAVDFSSWAAVYDEYKAEEFKFVFKETMSGTPSDNGQLAVLAYDPLNNTALGSTAGGADHSIHMLWGQNFATSSAAAIPSNVTKHGLMTFAAKIPRGVAFTSSTELEGMWVPTSVGVSFGYIKPYVEGLGSGATSNLRGILYIKTRFRSRG